MKFSELTLDDFDVIKKMYASDTPRKEVQETLSDHFDVSERTIRKWANDLDVGVMSKNVTNPQKIMVYDIETSRAEFSAFWTGKQYLGWRQMTKEPAIISVSWKWLGNDKVHHLHWDLKTCSDEQLMKEFVVEYNKADMVVGYNNNRFDNRWINARAMKYGLPINVFVKSFDLMKNLKRLMRVPSYAMAYMAEFFGCTLKLNHSGIGMWDRLERGTMDEKKEAIAEMLEYNIGDIITTEEIFLKTRKYMGAEVNFATLRGGNKWQCPHTGSEEVQLDRVTSTKAGTLQYIMIGAEGQYKISQRDYNKFLEFKIDNFNES